MCCGCTVVDHFEVVNVLRVVLLLITLRWSVCCGCTVVDHFEVVNVLRLYCC